jgi:Domain of unknown function (DUF4383)
MSTSNRTLAQLYAGGFGAVLLLTGIIGFFVDSSFTTPPTGDELIVFDVNGWHNVVHVLSGVAGLVLMRTAAGGRAFALGFGVIYGVVTLWGLIAGDSVLGIVAVNGADNLLHLAIAVTGIVAGLASRPERAPSSPIAAT